MNPFERIGRIAKANALISAIDRSGLRPSSRDVRGWAEPTWKILTDIVNQDAERPIGVPSVRTREMVANILAERERLMVPRSVLGKPRKGAGNVIPLGAGEASP